MSFSFHFFFFIQYGIWVALKLHLEVASKTTPLLPNIVQSLQFVIGLTVKGIFLNNKVLQCIY